MDRDRTLKWLPWISTPLLVAALLGAWKLSTVLFDISRFVLPPPEDVAVTLAELVRDPEIWLVHARVTLVETVAGFLIALVTAHASHHPICAA